MSVRFIQMKTLVLLFLFCRGHKWKWLMRLLPGQSEAILPCWITKISSKKHLTSTLQSDRRDMIGLDFSFVHNFIFLTFLITSGLKVFYVIHVMYIFHQVLQQQIKCSWYSCIMTFLCDIYWEFVPIVVIATLLLLSIYMNALTSQDIHCALCRIWNIRSLTEKFVFPLGIIFVFCFCCWQPTNFCKKYNLFEKKKTVNDFVLLKLETYIGYQMYFIPFHSFLIGILISQTKASVFLEKFTHAKHI